MTSTAHQIETLQAEYLDPRLYDDDVESHPLRASRGAILAPLSRAFDLAEHRRDGHAQRVAFVALYLAKELGLEAPALESAYFAALLHDAGMAGAIHAGGSDDFPAESREWAEILGTLNVHCESSAQLARKLGLGDETALAVAHHHDAWNGSSPPGGLSGEDLPLIARVVAVADRVETLIDRTSSPLQLRRTAPTEIEAMGGIELDPALALRMSELARNDRFWLGFYGDDLQSTLQSLGYGGMLEGDELTGFLGVIADLIDDRNGRSLGQSRQIASLAAAIAETVGLSGARVSLLRNATLLHDIGTLGVPVALLHKPDILTVGEMATMQLHPTLARDILSDIPGFGPAAWWVACHHERVDGKGYPAMLEGQHVPLEAQIIGISETYEALTHERPYRGPMRKESALEVLRGLAGQRFDPAVVEALESNVGRHRA